MSLSKRCSVAQHPKLLLRQLGSILLLFKGSYPSALLFFVFANMEYYSQHTERCSFKLFLPLLCIKSVWELRKDPMLSSS